MFQLGPHIQMPAQACSFKRGRNKRERQQDRCCRCVACARLAWVKVKLGCITLDMGWINLFAYITLPRRLPARICSFAVSSTFNFRPAGISISGAKEGGESCSSQSVHCVENLP